MGVVTILVELVTSNHSKSIQVLTRLLTSEMPVATPSPQDLVTFWPLVTASHQSSPSQEARVSDSLLLRKETKDSMTKKRKRVMPPIPTETIQCQLDDTTTSQLHFIPYLLLV